jgi:hypothetical protein
MRDIRVNKTTERHRRRPSVRAGVAPSFLWRARKPLRQEPLPRKFEREMLKKTMMPRLAVSSDERAESGRSDKRLSSCLALGCRLVTQI